MRSHCGCGTHNDLAVLGFLAQTPNNLHEAASKNLAGLEYSRALSCLQLNWTPSVSATQSPARSHISPHSSQNSLDLSMVPLSDTQSFEEATENPDHSSAVPNDAQSNFAVWDDEPIPDRCATEESDSDSGVPVWVRGGDCPVRAYALKSASGFSGWSHTCTPLAASHDTQSTTAADAPRPSALRASVRLPCCRRLVIDAD